MKHGRCMDVTQFQFESAVVSPGNRGPQQQSRFASAGRGVHTAIDSLMLGLTLRGWLTDDDKELLDRLAADNYLTFVIKRQRYLHPEGLDLFPLDLIQTARPEAANALFRHHYQPEADRHCGGYVIHSAFINEPDTEPVTLGMFGGNRPSKQNATETYFAELVERFRRASARAQEFVNRYEDVRRVENPLIIVDRCSGRLFYSNESANSLLGKSGRQLVGREFRHVKAHLSALAGKYRWTMRNVGFDDCLYTLVSFECVREAVDEPHHESIAQIFVHKMRNKIAGITTAASHLRTLSAEQDDHDAQEMAELIVGEVTQLNDLLSNLHVMFDYNSLPRRLIDASALFDEALDQEAELFSIDWDITNIPFEDGFNITASTPALRSLFVAVLRAHFDSIENGRPSWLRTRRVPDGDSMTLEISSGPLAADERSSSRDEWKKYADELASMMSIGLAWEGRQSGDTVTTKIEMKA